MRPDHRAEVVDEGVLARNTPASMSRKGSRSTAAAWATASASSLPALFTKSTRYWSDRARVRWHDSPLTTPSRISRTGLIERSDPKKALAAPVRPPFVRCP